jgi:ABC-2 type transport system permease protein
MKAVFKNELGMYFTGLAGYVFCAVLLLFAGVYTYYVSLLNTYANYEYVLNYISFIFIAVVPLLTMRVIAEERKQKTDQLLYALPLGMTKVILGKFFAMAVMLAIPTAIICIYPVILSQFGSIYLPAVYSSMIGFYLLGLSLMAIGMFISSVTESPAIAAGLCFLVMILNYYLYTISQNISNSSSASLIAFTILVAVIALIVRGMTKNNFIAFCCGAGLEIVLLIAYFLKSSAFYGLFTEFISNLSLFERFYAFSNGVFDITGVIYFITVIGLFLFFSVQSMEKRRWS